MKEAAPQRGHDGKLFASDAMPLTPTWTMVGEIKALKSKGNFTPALIVGGSSPDGIDPSPAVPLTPPRSDAMLTVPRAPRGRRGVLPQTSVHGFLLLHGFSPLNGDSSSCKHRARKPIFEGVQFILQVLGHASAGLCHATVISRRTQPLSSELGT